jgi:hypothetical protein
MVGRVEGPPAPHGIPYSAEAAGSGREVWVMVIRSADGDAAALFKKLRQASDTRLSGTPFAERGIGIANGGLTRPAG